MLKVPPSQTLYWIMNVQPKMEIAYSTQYSVSVIHNWWKQQKIETPTMDTNGNLFTFIHQNSNYIEHEKISKR